MKNFFSTRIIAGLAWLGLAAPGAALAVPFTPGNLVVVRVGDGTTATPTLSSTSTTTYLLEYTPSGTLVQTITLPTATSGTNAALTNTGSSSSDALLTRSADGRYLIITGYDAAPGVATLTSTAATANNRIIGRVAPDGTVDTSTRLADAFSGTTATAVNIRSAASPDGTYFYAVGSSGGVRYVPFGNPAATATVSIATTPSNNRGAGIYGGNLYVSSSTSGGTGFYGLTQIGTGLPTTAGQSAALLPGFPASVATGATTPSPYAFYFADLSTTVPGVDVVYVADDRAAPDGGVQKWSLVGSTWTLNGTVTGVAARGLGGSTTGTTVSLGVSGSAGLYFITDNAGYNAAPSTATFPAMALATPGTNSSFRGVAFAPVAAAVALPTITSFTPTSGPAATTVTVTGTNFTGATAVKLNGVAITGFTVVNATTITFAVPAGAASGTIAVTTPGGTATSAGAFTVVPNNPAPTITSLAPATAVAGSGGFTLTLTGTNFISSSGINFNGTALTTTYVSTTQLTAAVPASAIATAGTYNVTVTNPAPGGGTSAASAFTVTAAPPTITSFTPTTGGPGTAVTITGTNFTGATAVRIGSFAVTNFTVASPTSITLVVPGGTGSVNGLVTVVTPGGTAVSTATFNLVSATLAANALPGLTVFPNPATDRLTVELPTSAPATVALRDLAGRLVLASAPLAADHQLRLPAGLALGMYLLEVQQGGTRAVRRIERR